MAEDPQVSQARVYPRSGGRIVNGMEILEAKIAFNASLPGDAPWSNAYPPDFPIPRVVLSERRLPDFNIIQNVTLISEPLRCAMMLPATAAQFLPIKNLSRSPLGAAATYWFFHLRSFASAIDGERSDCGIDKSVSAKTRAEIVHYTGLTAIRLRSDVVAPADLFRDAVEPTIVFATDALASRVVDAGCTGVQFRHPLWFAPGFDQIVKTRDGAARLVWDKERKRYTLEDMSLDDADRGPSKTR